MRLRGLTKEGEDGGDAAIHTRLGDEAELSALALLKNGAAGLAYVLKDRLGDLDELLRALREVVAGRSLIGGRRARAA